MLRACTALLLLTALAGAQSRPASLRTRWAGEVTAENVHPDYPRPQFQRVEWFNLNGSWEYAITPRGAARPERFTGRILVPFPVESALSGVQQRVGPEQRLWYRRTFRVPDEWGAPELRLHFGAVDWEAVVWLNGRELGTHCGGYDGFSFDLTPALVKGGEQELVVAVWDPSDAGWQPRGKQVNKPEGIWYTPTTGIWQTVWLEPLPATSFASARMVPDVAAGEVILTPALRGNPKDAVVRAIVRQGDLEISRVQGKPGEVLRAQVPNARLWSPETPYLYDLTLEIERHGVRVDRVDSYFGMRTIALGKDAAGTPRILLNGKPAFQLGPLDQGFWPDGLYTAPTDAALRYDLEVTKRLGFNMVRKHVKVEPQRWYYWADKLGLLVWQDMPSTGLDLKAANQTRLAEAKETFERELAALIDGRENHPSIVMWVPFNEGWGQYDTERITRWTEQRDPTRLVDNASGWTDKSVGHVMDIHDYPGPSAPKIEGVRAGVLGEFGGLGLPLAGHTWQDEKNWGYRSFTDRGALTDAYVQLLRRLHPLAGAPGLCAAVYTQATDVEIEVNGLMTYDRELLKMDEGAVDAANRRVFTPPPPPPRMAPVVATSQETPVEWRYTTQAPAADWATPAFDDKAWSRGPAGFGTRGTPGAVVRTEWKTADLWIRRAFVLPPGFKPQGELQLLVHHDEDAEVFVNGQLVVTLAGHTTAYELVPLDARVQAALRPVENTLAVHCRQTRGGQYLDLGLVDVITAPPPASAPTSAPASAPGERARRPNPGNRAPLRPAPFVKLPIGSIRPDGWLRAQLELMASGMVGHLPELSHWCKFEGNAWAAANGQGHSGWEELPYWLKGFGDLGYVLGDQRIIAEARRWIDAVLASQDEEGWFGPRALQTSLKGHPDLWPHMVMLNVLQSFHEWSGDARVLPFLLKYHEWLHRRPIEDFGRGYWPRMRFGDNVETAHWLYNRTGEAWLLSLAAKIHANMQDWTTGVHDWHNVNIAQGFRAPTVFWPQSGEDRHRTAAERNYRTVMERYGQFPGGGFAGDENCRPGYTDPRQGFETCGIVEFMHSFELLTRITGDAVWADRCEEIAFNSLPAAVTPSWKGLRYLTCANQVQADRGNKAPAIQNGGTMFSFSPGEVYRCCQHNVSHGWPYFAEELWLQTPDRGLCAAMYAPCTVTAQVGDGAVVTIEEETDYPFGHGHALLGDQVKLTVRCDRPVSFPLLMRIPAWCRTAKFAIRGSARTVSPSWLDAPPGFARIDREWQDGEVVVLVLPREVETRRWPHNHGAASVHYGALTFALPVAERWQRSGGSDAWPDWEVFPAAAWNYGLDLTQPIELALSPPPFLNSRQPPAPFTQAAGQIVLTAKARRIPAWQQDRQGLVGALQSSPVKSEEPVETLRLIPMGASRLRISCFPVVGNGPDAHTWQAPVVPPVSASHCFANDSVEALIDGKEPKDSCDHSIPRFSWWDHRGTKEWVEWSFGKPRALSATSVYWFDDARVNGQCRVPKSWRVLYRADGKWMPVVATGELSTRLDTFNRATFQPVTTDALRIEVELAEGVSGGILEWRVEGPR